MAYKIARRTSFDRDLKSFKKQQQLKQEILDNLDRVIRNPSCGEELKGNWQGVLKLSFHTSPEIRLLYIFYPCCSIIPGHSIDDCRFEEVLEDDEGEPIGNAHCEGLIEFVNVKTREECNNYYKLSKKEVGYLKRE